MPTRSVRVTALLAFLWMTPIAVAQQELVFNGHFEFPSGGWSYSGAPAPAQRTCGCCPHSGSCYGILGNVDSNSDAMWQFIHIPSSATLVDMSYWWDVDTSESPGGPIYDWMTARLVDQSGGLWVLGDFSNQDAPGGYRQKSWNLLAFAGQTVQLRFVSETDSSLPTTFRIDDVSISVWVPQLAIHPSELHFGSVAMGSCSDIMSFELSHFSGTPTSTGTVVANTPFYLVGPATFSLAGSESMVFDLRFCPEFVGPDEDHVIVISNSVFQGSNELPCYGTGLAIQPGTIRVRATLDGDPWGGYVNFELLGSHVTYVGGVPFEGDAFQPGSYTLVYNGGGPSNASLSSVTPTSTQELGSGGTITFWLNYTTNTDTHAFVNGGFEVGTIGWNFGGYPAPGEVTCDGCCPHGGICYGVLGFSNNNDDSMWQFFRMPEAGQITIDFWLDVETAEPANAPFRDYVDVMLIDESEIWWVLGGASNQDAPGGYRHTNVDLTQWHGQDVQLYLRAHTDGSLPTTFRFDDAALTVATIPSNDSCENGIPIFDGLTDFSNMGATTDGTSAPLCFFDGSDQIYSDVWYQYSATCTGTVEVDVCTAGFDSKAAIYGGGSCVGSILDCDDDGCGAPGAGSTLSAPVVLGQPYKLRIGGFGTAAPGAQGSGSIFITCRVTDEPNLVPYQPPGWSQAIVVSNVTGTHVDAVEVASSDTLYIDLAWANAGPAVSTQSFWTALSVDGEIRGLWPTSSVGVGQWLAVSDYNLGQLAPGFHELSLGVDAFDGVSENNEGDNVFERTVFVSASPTPILSVAPAMRNLGSAAGWTTFVVSNSGGGVMPWTASVIGAPWLGIGSGAAGVDNGMVQVIYSGNPSVNTRSGTIRVSAPGASPAQVDVSVVQAGTGIGEGVDHFEFSGISSPQVIDVPFSVSILARTSGGGTATMFDGLVALGASGVGNVTPNIVQFDGGHWTGAVSIDFAGNATSLSASGGGGVGSSNAFDVTGGTASGRLMATVVARDGATVVPGATVYLRPAAEDGGPAPLACLTGAGGTCELGDLVPGEYVAWASGNGPDENFSGASLQAHTLVGAQLSTIELRLRSEKCPVLLVPGIMGSTAGNPWIYPELPSDSPCLGAPILSLHNFYDPPGGGYAGPDGVGWELLRSLLVALEFEVIDVPWDWRISSLTDAVPECEHYELEPGCRSPSIPAWQLYLMPKIREAKERTGHDKVSIVAHSLGGLMTRAYIQSPLYHGDIDKLAMVGTPNAGSALTYYMWYGGDPATADGTGGYFSEFLAFYGETTRKLYRVMNNLPWYAPYNPTALELMCFYRDNVRSMRDLLTVYRFLDKPDGQLHALNDDDPTPLVALNQDDAIPQLFVERYGDASRVRTVLYASTSERTIRAIRVGEPSADGRYTPGVPVGQPESPEASGDGTVYRRAPCAGEPACEAIFDEITVVEESAGEHPSLIRVYAESIVAFLTEEPVTCGSGTLASGLPAAASSSGKLVVTASGRAQLELVDPLGNRSGVNLENGTYENGIPQTKVALGPKGSHVTLDNPTEGSYVANVSCLAGLEVDVHIWYAGEGGSVERALVWICKGDAIRIPVVLDTTSAGLVLVTESPSAPDALAAAPDASGAVQLTWQGVSDPDVVQYRIYGRRRGETRYTLLGSTPDTVFGTSQAWNGDGGQPAWFYSVVAVDHAGTESSIHGTVENQHRLRAQMALEPSEGQAPLVVEFADASAGEPSVWAWDFESDGVIDSTEQHPTHTYGSAGTYSVTLVVGSSLGTDSVVAVSAVNAFGESEWLYGDADRDNDVDLADFAVFAMYVLGPGTEPAVGQLARIDGDSDGDVDLRDLGAFQVVYTGSQ